MDKKTFIKLMTDFLFLLEDTELVHKSLKKLDPDWGGLFLTRHETLIVTLFEQAMGDTSQWIGYWLYELEQGKKWHKKCVTDKNGKDVKLKTLNDLWDIIKNKNI